MKSSRIILTGFMGTGKTAVGRALAKKLSFTFFDTDLMVEETTGKTVTAIFEKEGEAAFRIYEKQMVKKALEADKIVVSTGGGAIVDSENRKLMKERGCIVGLSAPSEAILQRIQNMDTRPLLNTQDRLKKIEALLSHRSPYYREADIIVDTSTRSVDETVEEILKFLHGNSAR